MHRIYMVVQLLYEHIYIYIRNVPIQLQFHSVQIIDCVENYIDEA